MKDYKEKYENALEIARKINNGDGVPAPPDYTICEVIFPELKESEDERIRKEIIQFLQLPHPQFVGKRNYEKWIDWLEKRVEQKPVDKCAGCNNVKGCITCTDGDQYAHITEQKPTDKVKPKFKVGDWVVQENIGVYKVTEICEYWYEVIDIKDNHYSISFGNEPMVHLWTIQDAKDGDVLYHKYPLTGIEYIVMSKGINGFGNIDSYFRYNSVNGFGTYIPSVFNAKSDDITPATKEQRDLLFAKMKEAGYEWDANKKKLKKIEQKSTWSEEDERNLEKAIECCTNRDFVFQTVEEQLSFLDWLKSLKDSVQSQNLTVTDEELIKARNEAYNDALDKIEYHSGEPTFDDGWSAAIWYLKKKNAQPQSTWKPSDEQMRELSIVATGMGWFNKEVLSGLLEQLKKLREG